MNWCKDIYEKEDFKEKIYTSLLFGHQEYKFPNRSNIISFDTGGELISNTLYFELKYGWTGLLVEPNPDGLRELYSKHRKSTILPHCLSTKPEVEVVNFDVSNYVSGIIVEGKQKPSRIEGDPDRPQMFYERQIEVSKFLFHLFIWVSIYILVYFK